MNRPDFFIAADPPRDFKDVTNMPSASVDNKSSHVSELSRSQQQNNLMWKMLTEVSAQVLWHGQKLSKGEWKDVLTAAIKRQKVVPGIDGGFVVLGTSTSAMKISDMTELIELILAFGAQQNVKFSPHPMYQDAEPQH